MRRTLFDRKSLRILPNKEFHTQSEKFLPKGSPRNAKMFATQTQESLGFNFIRSTRSTLREETQEISPTAPPPKQKKRLRRKFKIRQIPLRSKRSAKLSMAASMRKFSVRSFGQTERPYTPILTKSIVSSRCLSENVSGILSSPPDSRSKKVKKIKRRIVVKPKLPTVSGMMLIPKDIN